MGLPVDTAYLAAYVREAEERTEAEWAVLEAEADDYIYEILWQALKANLKNLKLSEKSTLNIKCYFE